MQDTVARDNWFYFNYAINVAVLVFLVEGKSAYFERSIDKYIGDFSYLLYFFHWQTGFIASMVLRGHPVRGVSLQGGTSLILALALSAALAYVSFKFVDQPVQQLRSKIRDNASKD